MAHSGPGEQERHEGRQHAETCRSERAMRGKADPGDYAMVIKSPMTRIVICALREGIFLSRPNPIANRSKGQGLKARA